MHSGVLLKFGRSNILIIPSFPDLDSLIKLWFRVSHSYTYYQRSLVTQLALQMPFSFFLRLCDYFYMAEMVGPRHLVEFQLHNHVNLLLALYLWIDISNI